jgi:CRP-like cAMP-binding protein
VSVRSLGSDCSRQFCDTLLSSRATVTFEKDEVLYDRGDGDRTFFFLQSGVVKVGTMTEDGHEIIYDVRKTGEVVGELSIKLSAGSSSADSRLRKTVAAR